MPARAYIYEPSEKDRKAGSGGQLLFDGEPFPYFTVEAPKVEESIACHGGVKYITLVIPVYEVVYSLRPIIEEFDGKPVSFPRNFDNFCKVGPHNDYFQFPLVHEDIDWDLYRKRQ